MQRILTADGRFISGDPQTGTPGTIVTSKFMNDIQDEICNVITGAGLELDGEIQTQLLDALEKLLGDAAPKIATEAVAGILKIASTEQAQELTDDLVVLTPQKLGSIAASETKRGISRFATVQEMLGFMRTDIAATPLTVSAALWATCLGLGQTYQDVLSIRARNTNYTNTTGRPIFVAVAVPDVIESSGQGQYIQAEVGGVAVAKQILQHQAGEVGGGWVGFIVPPGETYKVTLTSTNNAQNAPTSWVELR